MVHAEWKAKDQQMKKRAFGAFEAKTAVASWLAGLPIEINEATDGSVPQRVQGLAWAR